MAGEEGFEPTDAGIRIRCLTTWRLPFSGVAGEEGLEPTNAGIKTRCLTAWRLPFSESPYYNF